MGLLSVFRRYLSSDPGDDEQFRGWHGLRTLRSQQHNNCHRHGHPELGARDAGGLRHHPLPRAMGGTLYLSAVLVGRLVPPAALLVPLFVLFTTFHLIDTQIAVIITLMCFGLPFVIWMMSGFFSELPTSSTRLRLSTGAPGSVRCSA